LQALLEIEGISKSFAGVKAVREVSLSIQRGTINSIIGSNGAGKTTLFNIVDGYLHPDAGTAAYKGERLDGLSPAQRASIGIGRLWQDIRLFRNMTVLDNLLTATKNHPGEKFLNYLLSYKSIRRAEDENLHAAERTLGLIGLRDKRKTLAQDLSYGQQKLLAIGRLLMNDADLLLLDEPTAGVNPILVDEVMALIKKLAGEGKTILMIEHNVLKAISVSDWVFVMDRGRIEISGAAQSVFSDPRLKEVYLAV
jgi:ABC-type branched-subunit amino acid transport system ATPase component